jgi:hypothetical protein
MGSEGWRSPAAAPGDRWLRLQRCPRAPLSPERLEPQDLGISSRTRARPDWAFPCRSTVDERASLYPAYRPASIISPCGTRDFRVPARSRGTSVTQEVAGRPRDTELTVCSRRPRPRLAWDRAPPRPPYGSGPRRQLNRPIHAVSTTISPISSWPPGVHRTFQPMSDYVEWPW